MASFSKTSEQKTTALFQMKNSQSDMKIMNNRVMKRRMMPFIFV